MKHRIGQDTVVVVTGATGGIGRATAAEHPGRREYWVGGSTVATILANRVAAGLLDRCLAQTGFSSQQTAGAAAGAAVGAAKLLRH